MSQNLPKRSLLDFLFLRHPNHFALAGANNGNVIITHRFLAAPVQANEIFIGIYRLYISTVRTSPNIRASYWSASSGRRNPCAGNYIFYFISLTNYMKPQRGREREERIIHADTLGTPTLRP